MLPEPTFNSYLMLSAVLFAIGTAGVFLRRNLITILLSVGSTFGAMQVVPERSKVLEVDRLVVRKELIVSDTGEPWEKGFEAQQVPRGERCRFCAADADVDDGVAEQALRGQAADGVGADA